MPEQPNLPANWKSLEAHPIALVFPAMTAEEYQTLKQDILERGPQEPILLYEGKILDGKARWRACKELDLPPAFVEWQGDQTTLTAWLQAKSRNLVRQHLSAERRVAVLRLSAQTFPEVMGAIQAIVGAAELRKQLGLKVPKQAKVKGEAADFIGRLVGASGSTVKRVLRVETDFPDRLKDLAEGKTTCGQVLKTVKQPEAAPQPLLQPPGGKKYQLIYAALDQGDLGQKSIQGWFDAKVACFLWSPPSRLQESFKLLLTWGLQFRTMFVWDRGKEIDLLLLATRNHQPNIYPVEKVVIKEKKPKEGGKPELFRELVAHLFPETEGKRLDMFSQLVPEGWDQEPPDGNGE